MTIPPNNPAQDIAGGGFNHHEPLEDQTQFWYEGVPDDGILLPHLTGRSRDEAVQILRTTTVKAADIRAAYPHPICELLILYAPPELCVPDGAILFCWYQGQLSFYQHGTWHIRDNYAKN